MKTGATSSTDSRNRRRKCDPIVVLAFFFAGLVVASELANIARIVGVWK